VLGVLRPCLGAQAVPEHRQHKRLIRAGPGPHGKEDAGQQRGEFGAADVGANDAGPLSTGE